MSELVLFRHGPAAERDPRRWVDDTERPLSTSGVVETEKAARGIRRLAPGITHVVSSPATRAVRTAEIARRALGVRPAVELWEELAPDSPAAPILSKAAEEVARGRFPMIVGHEPTLGELVGYALTGDEISLVRLGRAGAVHLRFGRAVTPGGGLVDWMLDRRSLARLRA
ncbi:MAG: histidine phosphatase family protein [Thermoplasmata archaeon]|nr:histidine phosphatase family protein [Thermoplasmata archaeon]